MSAGHGDQDYLILGNRMIDTLRILRPSGEAKETAIGQDGALWVASGSRRVKLQDGVLRPCHGKIVLRAKDHPFLKLTYGHIMPDVADFRKARASLVKTFTKKNTTWTVASFAIQAISLGASRQPIGTKTIPVRPQAWSKQK